jgi:hypothetical protein
MRRLRLKKYIADAAVDGVVPEGHLRTPPLGLLVLRAATVPRSYAAEEGYRREKSSFRPSAIVGCARIALRKTV